MRVGLVTLILLSATAAFGQLTDVAVLSESNLEGFSTAWTYHPGDNGNWANPDFDDSDWETRWDTWFEPGDMPQSGWNGIGWFRVRFRVDSTLWHRPIAYVLYFRGAAELYLDGQLVDTYGRVAGNPEDEVSVRNISVLPVTRTFAFSDGSEHVIAVRHSNYRAAHWAKIGGAVGGIEMFVSDPSRLTAILGTDLRSFTAEQFIFAAVPLAFALLFLLLFAFYRNNRNYLFFAVVAICIGAMTYLDMQQELLRENAAFEIMRRIHAVTGSVMIAALLRFMYGLFYTRLPWQFWAFLSGVAILTVWSLIDPSGAFAWSNAAGLLVIVELIRTIVVAIWRKKPGARIIGIGLLLFLAGTSYDMLLDLGLISPIGDATNGYYFGFLALLILMAVYLAREYAWTNRSLEARVVEVEELSEKTLAQERLARQQEVERLRLETENQRKALELEKAKELEASYVALEKAHEQLKSAQEQLVHSEKMASLGQLTAGIAHELKNPLNFITNFSQLSVELTEELEAEIQSASTANTRFSDGLDDVLRNLRANATRIREHGRRADEIIRSMMQHASGGRGAREATDLNRLLGDYIDLAYHGQRAQIADFNVNIERRFDETLGAIEVVPQDIGRVFLNLIRNAFDAVHEKAHSVEQAYEPLVRCSTRRIGDRVEIRISDNGPGIGKEVRDRIFEPFFSTKPTGSGTGLGLSLSYDIVTKGHGGTLRLERTDVGAEFVVTLPV